MSKTLLVAATRFEIEPLLKLMKVKGRTAGKILHSSDKKIAFLITGVGMVNTAFQMGKLAEKKFGLLINAGICGAIDRNLQLGDVVNITQDTLSEMGAEDDHEFIKFQDLELDGKNIFKSKHKRSKAIDPLKKVHGITVNKIHGSYSSIIKMKALFDAQVESMEGAAFLMAANEMKCNCIQVRAISNYVEKRDKSKWNIPLAIDNLNEKILEIIGGIK
jgi:futalosine hydrolase